MASSTIRFSGLASGIDTESIVKAMMTTYQSRIDTINKNTTLAEWKKDAYKEMSTKINNFKNGALATLTSGKLNKSKVTMSQEGAISVKTDSGTTNGTHKVQVEQVAEVATVNTKTIKSENGSKLSKTQLASDIEGMKTLIQNSATKDAEGNGYVTLDIGGAKVKIDETTTIQGLEDAVNKALADENIDATFKFDVASGAFMIHSNNTGSDQSLDLSGTDAAVLSALGVQESANGNYQYSGQNAVVVYNGGVTIESASNDIEVNGLKFTAVTETAGAITINIDKDIDSMVETISNFVKEYNTLLEEMNGKLNADSAKGYDPLTDEEKEALTEKEIEKWEDKIKGAILRKDGTLSELTSLFRTTMTTDYKNQGLDSSCSMLAQIGISSKNWSDQGKLTLDETKLREALTKDSDAVANLLNKISSNLTKELTERSASTDLRTYGQYFSDKTLTSKISSYAAELEKAQDRYDAKENALYKKFSAMETAMNNMNSQSSLFATL